MTWHASTDATPDWHVQSTVYDEDTGERVATVFGSQANIAMVTAAPDMLRTLQQALPILSKTSPLSADLLRDMRQIIYDIENASEVPA